MDILVDRFGFDISKIIARKLCKYPCYFENCLNESLSNNYCRKHWCSSEHPTKNNSHGGYCLNCMMKIMKMDKKKYIRIHHVCHTHIKN